jgi:hypothetical protein
MIKIKSRGRGVKDLNRLEETIGAWFKGLPHLPENGRKWVAENLWWLTLIGVILGAIGAFTVLSALLTGAMILGVSGSLGVSAGGMIFTALLLTLAFSVANVIIAAFAISPLKSMKKLGWSLLFLIALINVASLIIGFIFNQNVISLIYGLLFAAVGGYFLFEIRDFYGKVSASKRSHHAKS